jgi:hypothetical protein
MKGLNWKDILERAEWTFAQAFLAVVGVGVVTDVATYKAGAIAGIAAVLSMLKNVVKQNTTTNP